MTISKNESMCGLFACGFILGWYVLNVCEVSPSTLKHYNAKGVLRILICVKNCKYSMDASRIVTKVNIMHYHKLTSIWLSYIIYFYHTLLYFYVFTSKNHCKHKPHWFDDSFDIDGYNHVYHQGDGKFL